MKDLYQLQSVVVSETARLARASPRAALQRCVQAVQQSVARRFATSTTPRGKPWAALRKPRPGGKPLVRSGRLASSVRVRVEREGLVISSDVPYAGYQDQGTRTIPARAFSEPDEQALKVIERELGDWLAGELFKGV